jgi:hypothetical protein
MFVMTKSDTVLHPESPNAPAAMTLRRSAARRAAGHGL